MGGKMSRKAWQEYIEVQRPRYLGARRQEKGRILAEGCALFDVHRKALIRALRRGSSPRRKCLGRGRQYGSDVLEPLKKIWLLGYQPCGKRLRAMMGLWLPHYERHYGALSEKVRGDLLSVSASTMDRLLRPVRAKARKGLCATRSAKHVEGQIPIRTSFQKVDGPGWLEVDTVAHCGTSLAGAFVWSVTFTDIWSGWTEIRALWNRSAREIVERLREIEQGLAFAMEGFDSDNGREFMNYRLLHYLRDRASPVELTRSRPYRKNDNAHVEQKQWTHVRQLLGYDRFENRRLVGLINNLYRNEWRAMQNFLLPSMQLISKSREGGHLRRHHGPARTPYERLLESPKVSQQDKDNLRREFQSLDPIALHKTIEEKLREIFRLVRKQTTKVMEAFRAA